MQEMEQLRQEARKKIMLAADVNTWEGLDKIIHNIAPHVGVVKIGLEAITALGAPQILSRFDGASDIFYDGKFNDIPNTIEGAVKALIGTGVTFFNIHANSGRDSILRAVAAAQGTGMKVLVVTVLTTINDQETEEYYGKTSVEQVIEFARLAKECGADGIVCSAKELVALNAIEELQSLLKVTPGIQPKGMQANDQKRVMTPEDAIEAGADFLVIGRAITEAADPIAAINMIVEEMAEGLKKKQESAVE